MEDHSAAEQKEGWGLTQGWGACSLSARQKAVDRGLGKAGRDGWRGKTPPRTCRVPRFTPKRLQTGSGARPATLCPHPSPIIPTHDACPQQSLLPTQLLPRPALLAWPHPPAPPPPDFMLCDCVTEPPLHCLPQPGPEGWAARPLPTLSRAGTTLEDSEMKTASRLLSLSLPLAF